MPESPKSLYFSVFPREKGRASADNLGGDGEILLQFWPFLHLYLISTYELEESNLFQ